MCLVTAREMARHRLRRIPFVGVPRAAILARTAGIEQAARHRADGQRPRRTGIVVEDFFGDQAWREVGARGRDDA